MSLKYGFSGIQLDILAMAKMIKVSSGTIFAINMDKGGGNRGARGAMAPLKIFLEGPGPSKITDDPSSAMNFYSTLYI